MNSDVQISALQQLVQSSELEQWMANNLPAIQRSGGIFTYVPCAQYAGRGGPVLKIDPVAYPGNSVSERPWVQVGVSEPGRGLDTVRANYPIETMDIDHQHAVLDKFFQMAERVTPGDHCLEVLREQLQVIHA